MILIAAPETGLCVSVSVMRPLMVAAFAQIETSTRISMKIDFLYDSLRYVTIIVFGQIYSIIFLI